MAALLALPFALAACAGGGGGGANDEDAAELLDKAFGKPVPSADLDVDLQLDVKGRPDFEDPLRIRASGPYVRSERSLPQLDLDVTIEAQGAGQAVEAGILSTGDRLFVEFGGAYYEQDPAVVERSNRRLGRERGGGSLSDLGLDARKWVVDAEVAGEEEIGGVTTEHVTGTLDVAAALTDVNGLVKQSAGALDAGDQRARPLRASEIERLARSVDDPSFDVYVGKDDGVLRRIALRIDADVPERDRAEVGGMTAASVRLAAQLEDVGGDQSVEPPRSSRPLSDLTTQLGSLRALTGGGTSTQGDDAATGLDGFERYSQCLDAADPDDADAIATCRALLR